MRKWFGYAILLLWLLTACAAKPDIYVEDAWVRPDPMMENAAGYMTIRNGGNADDALIGVQAASTNQYGGNDNGWRSGICWRLESLHVCLRCRNR